MQLCFFSDATSDNFLPLTLTRPVSELRVGILTIKEKWIRHFSPSSVFGIVEPHLEPVFGNKGELNDEKCLWINERYLPSNELVEMIPTLESGTSIVFGEDIVCASLPSDVSGEMLSKKRFESSGITQKKTEIPFNKITFLWDLLSKNASEINSDIKVLRINSIKSTDQPSHSTFINPKHIFIEEGVTIEPGCILMADKGPIYIGSNAIIEAGTILKGPVAVCEGATVKMRARINDGTTIGPVCKVGGEVSNSIFHSYSNKGHDGFVGNSLVGQWCNFGADTNTSNLKNNYGKVHLQNWITTQPYEEGIQFLGTVMGDHSKTSINSMLNTGTICGVSSNIFASGFPPKYIPSFSWIGDTGLQVYRLEKALEAMQAMMKRRHIEMDENYRQMMSHIFSFRNH